MTSPRTAVGSEFQAVGPDTEKLRDPYRDSRQRGILKSRRERCEDRDSFCFRWLAGIRLRDGLTSDQVTAAGLQ